MLVMTGAFAVRSAAGFGAVLGRDANAGLCPAGIDGGVCEPHLGPPGEPRLAPGCMAAFCDHGVLFVDRHAAGLYFINLLDEFTL